MAETVEERARALAGELAVAVRQAGGRGRPTIWRKMSTLMAAVGMQRLTAGLRQALEQALLGEGLTAQPSMREVTRSQTVRFSSSGGGRPTAVGTLPPGLLRTTTWTRGVPGATTELDVRSLASEQYLVLQLDPSADRATIQQLLRAVLDVQLDDDLTDDLLSPDPTFRLERYDDPAAVHLALAGAEAREETEAGDGSAIAGWTLTQPVEVLVAERWCLLVWHQPDALGPDGRQREDASPVLSKLVSTIRQERPTTTSAFVGLLCDRLVESFEDVVDLHRSWLDSWEVTGDTDDPVSGGDPESLNAIRRHIQHARRRLHGHERIVAAARRHGWLEGPWAERLGETEEYAKDLVAEFRELDRQVQAAQATLHSRELARQAAERAQQTLEMQAQRAERDQEMARRRELEQQRVEERRAARDAREAEREAARVERLAAGEAREKAQNAQLRLESTIGLVTALLLGPGLVAGLFGANVWFPGRDEPLGLVIMGVAIVVVVIVASVLYRRGRRDT
ncbi:OmpH family outer membrane protein [Microlunatus sp. Y2014]|uniref:OmpH family outer membrane protein n=1 Tax=Microlunatus sp. Y2014 TaxID=3418488 RepID=UPI003DA70761